MRSRLVRRPAVALAIATLLCGTLTLSGAAELGLSAGDLGQVSDTDGAGLNLRAAPGADADLVAALPDATLLTIGGAAQTAADGTAWYPVTAETDAGALAGWVAADYVQGAQAANAPLVQTALAAQDATLTVNGGGESLNLRSGPIGTADALDAIPDGATVAVLAPAVEDPSGNWWSQVSYDGEVGYAATQYLGTGLVSATGDLASAALADNASATVVGTGGDGLNVRAAADANADTLTTVDDGAVVQVLAGPTAADGTAWYQVTADGMTGWVNGAFLVAGTPATADSAGGTTLGGALVATALAQLGAPYQWAGTTPDGFDSSGFTYYVVSQTLGAAFPRAIEDQAASGIEVAVDNLAPGDLLFFQNTYQPGLSYAGVYLGDGQFVSVGADSGAVSISNLNDPYWQARFLTARRVVGNR